MKREIRSGSFAVTARFDGDVLREITFPRSIPEDLDSAALDDVIAQLARFPIDLTEAPPFHRRVWQQLREIPRGTALTYAELALAVGSPRGYRAVGQACGANPLPLLIPCHRVVAQDGLGGFTAGLPWKVKLLELEAAV